MDPEWTQGPLFLACLSRNGIPPGRAAFRRCPKQAMLRGVALGYDRAMRSLSRTSLYASVALAWLSVGPQLGCFLRPSTVITRFSGEFACPEGQVKVDKIDKESFRASGCNRRATYRCSGEYGELCQRVGQPETIRPEGFDDNAEPPKGGEPAAAPPQGEPAAL